MSISHAFPRLRCPLAFPRAMGTPGQHLAIAQGAGFPRM